MGFDRKENLSWSSPNMLHFNVVPIVAANANHEIIKEGVTGEEFRVRVCRRDVQCDVHQT